jgi:hypothetical protein
MKQVGTCFIQILILQIGIWIGKHTACVKIVSVFFSL